MSRKKKKSSSAISLSRLLPYVLILALIPASLWLREDRREQQQLAALNRRLESMGELVTVTQIYRSVFYTREKKNFIQDKSLLFSASYKVKAGVDLSEGFRVRRERDGLLLVLPPGRIFSVDGDDASFRQIYIKERFSSIHTGDYLPLIGEEADNIRQRATASDIQIRAQERAALILKGVFAAAGIDTIRLDFGYGGDA